MLYFPVAPSYAVSYVIPDSAEKSLYRMNPRHKNESLEWLGLHLEVPRDWQIVRHGLSKTLGTLRFTDRYGERMTLTWHTLSREPDLGRMVTEQQHKDQTADANRRIERLSIGGWQGYRVVAPERTWVRAVRFEPATRQLLDVALTLSAAHAGSVPVTEQLVSRIAVTNHDAQRARFCAFDIDAAYPSDLAVTKADVVPASVTLELERQQGGKPTKRPASAVVRRMGMAASWYGGNPMGLVLREYPHLAFGKPSEIEVGGHQALLTVADTTKGRISRWFGRQTTCRVLVFHCEAENAVYCVGTRSYERAPLLPSDIALCCCTGKDRARGTA